MSRHKPMTEEEKLERLEKLKRKKELKERLKEGSTWSFAKVLTTALVAVTMAVISSRLTTVVNSLLLVALVSIISATVSEIYRIVAVLASLGAKKVVAPIVPEVDLKKNKLEAQIEELKESLGETKDPVTAAIDAITDVIMLSPKPPEAEPEKVYSKREKALFFFKVRPNLMLVAVFTLVSLISVGASYYIANNVDTGNVYSTTIEKPVEELSTEDKEAIVDEATERAVKEAVDRALEEAFAQDAGYTAKLESTQAAILELQGQLEILSTNVDALSRESLAELNEKIATLEAELAALKASRPPATTPGVTP